MFSKTTPTMRSESGSAFTANVAFSIRSSPYVTVPRSSATPVRATRAYVAGRRVSIASGVTSPIRRPTSFSGSSPVSAALASFA